MEFDRTRHVTVFEGPDGRRLYRSGRFVGTLTVPAGRRPYPDRDAEYEPVRVERVGPRRVDAPDAVFAALPDGD